MLGVLMVLATVTASPPAERCSRQPTVNSTVLNARYTFAAIPSPRLVPHPTSLAVPFPAYIELGAAPTIVLAGTPADQAVLRPAALLLASDIAAATDGAVQPAVGGAKGAAAAATITLVLATRLSGEAYELAITTTGVTLTAGTHVGMVFATATLVQAVEFTGDVDAIPVTVANCTTEAVWRLPAMTIADGPVLPYRGIMVDAARAYLPLTALKAFVTLCRMYKLNRLHIHMTDDGSFTFPSTKYPELAANASFKYTLEELRELQAYANARGVVVIGEMDVPGHSSGLTRALPAVFGFPSKPTTDVCDFTSDATVAALQAIFDEIADVFPSDIIHMGGDEVNFNEIKNLPEIAAALKRENVSAVADLYRIFIRKMHSYAESRNRTLHVWEGFRPPPAAGPPSPIDIPKDIVVSPFDCNIFPAPQLADAGYKIINSAWTPLYIAAHGTTGAHHPFPPELVYRWNPWLFGGVAHALEWWQLSPEQSAAVVGAQMCVWQMSPTEHLCMLSSRAPAMAERLWNPFAGRTFEDYTARVNSTGRLLHKMLAAQGLLPVPPGPAPPGPVPSPPPPPSLPGYTGAKGACRDKDGKDGTNLYTYGPTHHGVPIAECAAMCAKLGARCEAYDWSPGWCGIWGTTLTGADSQTDASGAMFHFSDGHSGTKVCQQSVAAGGSNICYLRGGATCSAPVPDPRGGQNSQPGCLAGCSCV